MAALLWLMSTTSLYIYISNGQGEQLISHYQTRTSNSSSSSCGLLVVHCALRYHGNEITDHLCATSSALPKHHATNYIGRLCQYALSDNMNTLTLNSCDDVQPATAAVAKAP